jgi:hypothetical protein
VFPIFAVIVGTYDYALNSPYSGNPVNSANSGSDKINANLIRFYVLVGV